MNPTNTNSYLADWNRQSTLWNNDPGYNAATGTGNEYGLAKSSLDNSGLFGMSDTTWGNIGTLGNLALGGLAAYTNMQQLGLAKDAFKFNKDLKNKEYAMAKDAYDRNVARAKSIGNQMNAGKVTQNV